MHADCLTYLARRGGLSFAAAPFCEVDALILSILAYADFDAVVPPEDDGLPLSQALARLMQRDGWDRVGLLMSPKTPVLVRAAGESHRFGPLRLCACRSRTDDETQFAAMTFRLPDGTLFLAYRGTDDTIVGWRECFELSYAAAVPAQVEAAAYLRDVAARWPGKLRLGGHSKGGNLAVWAAVHAPAAVRQRIVHVYSNDGPGFSQDLTKTRAYRALRISIFVPQSSPVGPLLCQDSRYQVIRSRELGGVAQHDPFSWEVRGSGFRTLSRRSLLGRRSDRVLHSWIASLDPEERAEFTDALFSLLSADHAETLTDLSASWLDSALAAVRAYQALPDDRRRQLRGPIARLLVSFATGGRPHHRKEPHA